MLISIDPGVRHHACALFTKNQLVSARLVSDLHDLKPWVLDHILAGVWGVQNNKTPLESLDITIELPQIYALEKSKGGTAGQNDLINVAFEAGKIVRECASVAPGVLQTIHPRQWKGQIPKTVKKTNDNLILINRLKKRLTDKELACIELGIHSGLEHNVWDAVGIGMWAIGRY